MAKDNTMNNKAEYVIELARVRGAHLDVDALKRNFEYPTDLATLSISEGAIRVTLKDETVIPSTIDFFSLPSLSSHGGGTKYPVPIVAPPVAAAAVSGLAVAAPPAAAAPAGPAAHRSALAAAARAARARSADS